MYSCLGWCEISNCEKLFWRIWISCNIKLLVSNAHSLTFSTFTTLCHLFDLVPKHFHHPQRRCCMPLIKQSVPTAATSEPLATTGLLCLSMYLFRIFHINGIILCMTCCVWVLSLSAMISRFIHVMVHFV